MDLIQSPNIGGSGFDLIARGDPPKTGFQFNQSCSNNSAFGSYCMKSRFTGAGGYVGASAASAFPGLVQGNATALTAAIAGALQANGVPASSAGPLATAAIQYLGSRAPTNTDIATRVSFISSATTPLTTSQVPDIQPLGASYNQTYEVGYKGIIANRFRFDIAAWGQDRGDVATTAALATPNVWFGNPTQLGGYIGARLGEAMGPSLAAAGLTSAQINGLVGGIATALTGSLAPAPLGVVTFNSPNTSPTAIYATYQKLDKKVWVKGADIALDMVATDQVTLEGTYSWQNQNVWNDILIGGVPFMSNSAKSRGSVGARYRDEAKGMGAEIRTHFNEAYPVSSGVFSTNTAYAIAAGNTGAVPATTATGYNKCSPAAAGTFCYADVQQAFTLDLQFNKKFDIGLAQKLSWTLGATNILDKKLHTFPGTPDIGRMIMTRLQYTF